MVKDVIMRNKIHDVLIIGSSVANVSHIGRLSNNDIDVIGKEQDVIGWMQSVLEQGLRYRLISVKETAYGRAYFFNSTDRGEQIIVDAILVDVDGKRKKETDAELLEYACAHAFETNTVLRAFQICPSMLLTLKLSHRYLRNSPHFYKTMMDIRNLRSAGVVPMEPYNGFLAKREKETYDYGHPNLNVDKDSFFTDNVRYIYDHDSIHQAIAKDGQNPIYCLYLADNQPVLCDKAKFDSLTYEQKLDGVIEESCVLALERSIVPRNPNDHDDVFKFALMKVCTSITSGWFREFAWENYTEALARYYATNRYYNFVVRFYAALEAGKIKPFKTEE
jgi:hypothetical protein